MSIKLYVCENNNNVCHLPYMLCICKLCHNFFLLVYLLRKSQKCELFNFRFDSFQNPHLNKMQVQDERILFPSSNYIFIKQSYAIEQWYLSNENWLSCYHLFVKLKLIWKSKENIQTNSWKKIEETISVTKCFIDLKLFNHNVKE